MGDCEERRNSRKRATRQAKAIRIKACVDVVNFLCSASSMVDGSPIRCRRKGQRLVVDTYGDQIEQSLGVLCQKMNDDHRGNIYSRLQTLYKLVRETESKRDIAPPEERSRLQLVADDHFRELCRTFGQLCDLVNKSLQKLLLTSTTLDPRTLADAFGLLTATNAKESSPFGWLPSER
jgi:hypothetical protein